MKRKLLHVSKDINFCLKNFLKKQKNSNLLVSMKYGLFPGGKKIRSKIIFDVRNLEISSPFMKDSDICFFCSSETLLGKIKKTKL